jgi:hypothetical protein
MYILYISILGKMFLGKMFGGLTPLETQESRNFLRGDQRRMAAGRRKIRVIESNAKCRYLKKLTCKGTLRKVFYLSEALPSYDPPP